MSFDPNQHQQAQQPGHGQFEHGNDQQHRTQYQQHGQNLMDGASQQSAIPEGQDSGSYRNLSWTVKHRNTNSTLNVQFGEGDSIKSIPGAMVHMSPSVTLQGKTKVSVKKLFTGGSISESVYTGPGLVALAPRLFGDIVPLDIDQGSEWSVGKHAYLACTADVVKDIKSQGLGKALFSGEGLVTYRFSGEGVVWLTSFGAIETITLSPGEQHIIDTGHLVAWNCNYAIEEVGSGKFSSVSTGEGLVCRVTGPGSVFIQTRSLEDFEDWVRSHVDQGGPG